MKRTDSFSALKLVTAVLLIAFGAGGRYVLQDVPNIETIMVVSLLAGSLLGGVWTMAVGLIAIGITDIAIGNTSILLYTWTAWAAMGLLGFVLRKREKKIVRHSLELTGMGVLGTLLFFVWTNFGVWHIGGLYPHTLDGLMTSYVMALPFLRMHLVSTLLVVPAVSIVALTAWKYAPSMIENLSRQRSNGIQETN